MSGYYGRTALGGAIYTPLTVSNYVDSSIVAEGLPTDTVDLLIKSPYIIGDRNAILKAALKQVVPCQSPRSVKSDDNVADINSYFEASY